MISNAAHSGGSSDESGDLTRGLEQVAVFSLNCLFPNGGCNQLATFNDGVCSEVEGDSEEGQSQDNGKSSKEGGNVSCATVGGFLAWEFVFVCGVAAHDGSVLWWLSGSFD